MTKSILIAVAGLFVGVVAAVAYCNHFNDQMLADLQAQLDAANAKLAKEDQDKQMLAKETTSVAAQVDQLQATNDDLKKKLNDGTGPAPVSAPGVAPGLLGGIANVISAGIAQHNQEQLLMLKARLHLTPEQEALVKAAMDEDSKRAQDVAAKMLSSGKFDPQALAALRNVKSVDQTLDDVLSPDQKTAYAQMKTDQQNSAVETAATNEVNQMSPILQMSDSQKDQAYSALAQVQTEVQDPNWIKANVPTNPNDPFAVMEAQSKAKEDAMSKILTPDQMATYTQQTESQIAMQKLIMQKFMPPAAANASAAGMP